MNDTRKEAICNALAAFIRKRPGLEWANYATSDYDASRRAYLADKRAIERDKRDAEALLCAVRHNDGISADDILEASRTTFSGRLTILTEPTLPHRTRVDYCTGQYFPTEYRRAVATVCAAVLWDWQRKNMPKGFEVIGNPPGKLWYALEVPGKGKMPFSAGDWLRRKFRQEFGSAIQKRYFD